MALCSPDYFVHATLYSRDNRSLLLSDRDKERALSILQEIKKKFRLSVACYVVLDNRVDWLFSSPPDNWMFSSPRGSGTSTIAHFSKEQMCCMFGRDFLSHKPLWAFRVKKIVRRGSYELHKQLDSLHAEPIRLGLVKRAADYPWSSFPSRVAEGRFNLDWDRRSPARRKYLTAAYRVANLPLEMSR